MLAASRRPPLDLAMRPLGDTTFPQTCPYVWGNPRQFRGPRGGASPVATPATPVPKRQLCWGIGGGSRLYFPCSLPFSKNFPSPSSMGREKPRRPRRLSNPAGHAAPGGNSPPRAALGSEAGVQMLRTEAPEPRLLRELGTLIVGGARRRRCPRAALRCPDGSASDPGSGKRGSEPEARTPALNW